MSHIVSIQSRVQDVVAIAAACHRLGLTAPVQGTAKLFSGTSTGVLVQLPGWNYPAVIDVATRVGPDRKLHGDVDFEAVQDIASFITPVPRGVGPVTVAALMENVVRAAQFASGLRSPGYDFSNCKQ